MSPSVIDDLVGLWGKSYGDQGAMQLKHDHQHRFTNPVRYNFDDVLEVWKQVRATVGLVMANTNHTRQTKRRHKDPWATPKAKHNPNSMRGNGSKDTLSEPRDTSTATDPKILPREHSNQATHGRPGAPDRPDGIPPCQGSRNQAGCAIGTGLAALGVPRHCLRSANICGDVLRFEMALNLE